MDYYDHYLWIRISEWVTNGTNIKLAVSEENIERLNGLVMHICNNIIIET